MEIIRQGEQFYKSFGLENIKFSELKQLVIKCYSDIDSTNNITFRLNYDGNNPNDNLITQSPDYENRVVCFFSKEFTKDMKPGLWKVEALIETEANEGYEENTILKPLGNIFNVLTTTIS